jgi:hypothetical protein
MRVVRLMDEPNWQSQLSSIEEIFFATSPSGKTLRPDERQPFKERWLGRYIAYDIESFFVAITEVSAVAGYISRVVWTIRRMLRSEISDSRHAQARRVVHA